MPYKDPGAQRRYQADWHQRHRADRKHYVNQKRAELREEIKALKEATPCADCGQRFPYYVTDFDHREGEDKVEVVSRIILWYGRERALEEIAKCDLVCSNCHRIRTHERRVRAQALSEGSTPS